MEKFKNLNELGTVSLSIIKRLTTHTKPKFKALILPTITTVLMKVYYNTNNIVMHHHHSLYFIIYASYLCNKISLSCLELLSMVPMRQKFGELPVKPLISGRKYLDHIRRMCKNKTTFYNKNTFFLLRPKKLLYVLIIQKVIVAH